MAKYHVPAVSVAVIHGGRVEWAKGYGRLSEGGAPVTTESLFQAASISKSLASMAALHLVEEGKLSLDAPVATELKSWKLPENGFTAQHPVTLRELLSHTAGLNVHGFPGYAAGAAVPTLTQVLDGAKPANTEAIAVTAVPGQSFSYSGGGFTIMQQMVIDATGKPFPEVMKTVVLDPVGLKNSTYQQPLDAALMPRVAMPYDDQGKPIAGGPHMYPEMAAAGLWTTPTDLANWVIEMQESLKGKANHVLSVKTTRLMVTPVKDGYGLGVETQTTGGQASFSHSGGNEGYRTFYIGYENGDGAVIMTDGDNGGEVYAELLRSIATVYGWPDHRAVKKTTASLPAAVLTKYAGTFQAKDIGAFNIRLAGAGLEVELGGGPSVAMLPSAENAFFTTEGPVAIEVRFDTPDTGTVLAFDRTFAFTRTKEGAEKK